MASLKANILDFITFVMQAPGIKLSTALLSLKKCFQADQSEFHKCWCAILPLNHARTDRSEYGFLFTARKAPCDTSPVFERPLIGFHLNQAKQQNNREWMLRLQKDKLHIMLDDKDSRDDWVNAIRSAIKSKNFSLEILTTFL